MGLRDLGRDDRSSNKSPDRQSEIFSRRLIKLLSSNTGLEQADPDEVEGRIRNMTHGAGQG